MTRQKAPWSFAAVDIEVPSSGTREVLLTRASGDWTGWTVDGVTAPASVTDELTVTAPSSLLGRRWRLLDPDGRERIVGCVVAAKAGSTSEDLTVDVSTGATIVEVTIAGGGGGGAVDSVNGETGVVVLDAADVGAVPTARTITAGTGLTGGGDLSADRTLTVTYGATAGTAAEGNDARLTDARTPTAHAASHQDGGSDELALDGSQITSGTVAAARLGSGTPSAATFLRGDGTWAMDRLPFHHEQTIFTPTLGSGSSAVSYGTPGERFASNGHGMSGPGVEAWTPVWLDAGVYDKIGVRLTTAAASTWRLGVDAHDTTGQFRPATGPGSNLLDAGTVDMDTAPGWKILECSLTIASSGIYWLRALCTAFTAYPHAWSFLGYQSAAWMEFVTAGLTIDSYNTYGRVGWRSISGGTGGFLTTDHFYSMASTAPVVMLGRSA